MPRMSHTGWSGIPWAFCHCHQKQWPTSMLRRQDGLLKCPMGYDNPSRTLTVDRRQQQIAERLASFEEEPALAPILKDTTTDQLP